MPPVLKSIFIFRTLTPNVELPSMKYLNDWALNTKINDLNQSLINFLKFLFTAFDPSGMLRRTDSKESNCSSIHSMAHGREDLRQTLSVPVSAFHVSW